MEWISSILAAIAITVSVLSWLSARRNTRAAERNALAAERSAIAAIESNEHLRIQHDAYQEKERQRQAAYRMLYTKRLIKTARQIHDAILRKYQIDSPFAHIPVVIDWNSIKNVPQEIIFADDILIDIFTTEERVKIFEAWGSLNYLIDTYGMEDEERHGIGYAGQVISYFDALIRMLDKTDYNTRML